MPSVELRKRVIIVEEIFHEGGPVATTPYRRAAILAVIRTRSPAAMSRTSSASPTI